MARYLSDEWFEQVGAVPGNTDTGLAPATLVLQHIVSGAPGGDVSYHLRLAPECVEIVRGRAAHPDVTFCEDYPTAAAIASGALTAPMALLAGRIRVGGDMAALIAQRGILAIGDPIPAAVRAETSY